MASEEEIIIIGGGKKPNFALSPNGIVPHWRELWKHWTTWLIALLAFLPEILGQMISQGWLEPASSSTAFKVVAGVALAAKLVNQKKKQ